MNIKPIPQEPYGLESDLLTTPPEPHVPATVRCREHYLSGEVEFIVDTGATLTTIMPSDRKRLGIQPFYLVEGEPHTYGGVSSSGLPLKHLLDAEIAFQDVDGLPHVVKLPRLMIAVDRSAVAARRESILGRDVLQHCRIDLAADPPCLLFRSANPKPIDQESEES